MISKKALQTQLKDVAQALEPEEKLHGEIIFYNSQCQILSQSTDAYELIVSHDDQKKISEYRFMIFETSQVILPVKNGKTLDWDRFTYACLLQINTELSLSGEPALIDHKKYTREGMRRRVLKERQVKAEQAEYKIKWADNIFGDHQLTNENGQTYIVFLKDFDNETGYSNSPDAQLNKLGTTKHIMFAFNALKNNQKLYKRLKKSCPFVEIFCDPLNHYKISWFYPHELPDQEKLLITKYFRNKQYIEEDQVKEFAGFLPEATDCKKLRIRREVLEKVGEVLDQERLTQIQKNNKPDYTLIKRELFHYQKEGIEFALFKPVAVIADEMGLGKTIQAISVAVMKKRVFDFKRTLVVCPASLKEQWKNEIERFTKETACVISGYPEERKDLYQKSQDYFIIINYETILRDREILSQAGFDFIILDEAQRVKNFETKTALGLKQIPAKHKLVITGTPIENRLIDFFSIMSVLNPAWLGPLWEFSYKHCLFDPQKPNKINGYYNLNKLNEKISDVLIRREKRKVLKQLPNIQQIDVPVGMTMLQHDYHASYARGIASITHKKFLTPYDVQKLQMLLASMRMVCDSTYLIDEQTNDSPKLKELEYVLLEKLDIRNTPRKIIVFSEWIKVHRLIAGMLRSNGIGFVELSSKIPVKARGELIRKFEENKEYKIFLSTEAGGTGLNLQAADTVINFELPWNPAKKNQRIGRIDRLGQKSHKLTIINFITRNSIEEKIASGLVVKQNLFEGVLGSDSDINFVDFSAKGRPQFITELEQFVDDIEDRPHESVDAGWDSLEQFETPDIDEKIAVDADDGLNQPAETPEKQPAEPMEAEQMQQVMNHGMQFLAGLFRMSTGQDLDLGDQTIEVDPKTQEVTMKFKLSSPSRS